MEGMAVLDASKGPFLDDSLASEERKALFSDTDSVEQISIFGFTICMGFEGCNNITESGEQERGRRRQERN